MLNGILWILRTGAPWADLTDRYRIRITVRHWTPILQSLRNGDFWVSTGEILIKNYSVEGTGPKRTISADLEWTYPLEFIDVVWGDGKKVDQQIIRATDTTSHGTRKLSIRFDATGKVWVRRVVWDSAGNGAFVQPVWLNAPRQTTNTK